MIKKYDILIFVETKTDEFDEINLPGGYSYHVKHRKKFKRKSGGIIIIFKMFNFSYLKLRICSVG